MWLAVDRADTGSVLDTTHRPNRITSSRANAILALEWNDEDAVIR
jgi:hypothetical protein